MEKIYSQSKTVIVFPRAVGETPFAARYSRSPAPALAPHPQPALGSQHVSAMGQSRDGKFLEVFKASLDGAVTAWPRGTCPRAGTLE